jgi:hypothetical protein
MVESIIRYWFFRSATNSWKTLSHTPLSAQRPNRLCTLLDLPYRSGRSCQWAPDRSTPLTKSDCPTLSGLPFPHDQVTTLPAAPTAHHSTHNDLRPYKQNIKSTLPCKVYMSILPRTNLLIFLGTRAVSYAADMPNTLCVCSKRTKVNWLDELTGDLSLVEHGRNVTCTRCP